MIFDNLQIHILNYILNPFAFIWKKTPNIYYFRPSSIKQIYVVPWFLFFNQITQTPPIILPIFEVGMYLWDTYYKEDFIVTEILFSEPRKFSSVLGEDIDPLNKHDIKDYQFNT